MANGNPNGVEDQIQSDDDSVEQNIDDNGEEHELVVLDPEATDIDLNHGRIARIENLDHLQNVETLTLRWNQIKIIENLSSLSTLKELELYDNQISRLENSSRIQEKL